jgi:hypothetical protein
MSERLLLNVGDECSIFGSRDKAASILVYDRVAEYLYYNKAQVVVFLVESMKDAQALIDAFTISTDTKLAKSTPVGKRRSPTPATLSYTHDSHTIIVTHMTNSTVYGSADLVVIPTMTKYLLGYLDTSVLEKRIFMFGIKAPTADEPNIEVHYHSAAKYVHQAQHLKNLGLV